MSRPDTVGSDRHEDELEGGPEVSFGVVMMSEYRMGEGHRPHTSSEPCSSVRRASCTALWPQSIHPPPVSTPDQGTQHGVARRPCGLPIGGPPESRISAPVRSGGANRTAVGVKRPEPPDRVHARRRIDWSGWWPLVRVGMCHCRCQCQAVSTLSLGAPPSIIHPSIPSSSISVRQPFDVARGPWPGAWCRCEGLTGRHLGREPTHMSRERTSGTTPTVVAPQK